MNFLSKLFGSSTEQPKLKQRAPLKDQKHFERTLARTEKFQQGNFATITKMETEGRLEPFHHWNVAVTYLDKFYIYYSMGKPLMECYQVFMESAKAYKNGWDESAAYGDMLDMVSLGYLLDIPQADFQGIVEYIEKADKGSRDKRWKPDALLWYIINAKQPGHQQPTDVLIPSLYKKLFAITDMTRDKAPGAMLKYLEGWYKNHHDEPWYESHKKSDVYRGYWSFEAAAITKALNLDDEQFKNHPNYPYDLVHWSKEG